MSFSCPQQTSLTDAELNAQYSGAKPGLLSSISVNASNRESNGMLTTNVLSQLTTSLVSSGIIPKASAANSDEYLVKVNELLTNIKAEYCFYESRYKYVLQKLFGVVYQGYVANTPEATQAIKNYLEKAQVLNLKLNDFTQIISSLTSNINTSSSTLQQEVDKFNEHIQGQKVKLNKQNKLISSTEGAIKIKKEMVKYTEEKARHSDNLLKLYGFLNIVVVGLLVYIYKASSE